MLLRRQLLAPLLLLPSGCALLGTAKPERIFALTPLEPAQPLPARDRQIMVPAPNALLVLDSQRIAYRSGLEYQYYAGVHWEDTVPVLLQNLIIASLRNRVDAAVAPSDLTGEGARLTSELQDFQVEPGNQVHVTLVANFDGRSQRFERRRTAASDRMVDLVGAFDAAVHDVLVAMAEFVVM